MQHCKTVMDIPEEQRREIFIYFHNRLRWIYGDERITEDETLSKLLQLLERAYGGLFAEQVSTLYNINPDELFEALLNVPRLLWGMDYKDYIHQTSDINLFSYKYLYNKETEEPELYHPNFDDSVYEKRRKPFNAKQIALLFRNFPQYAREGKLSAEHELQVFYELIDFITPTPFLPEVKQFLQELAFDVSVEHIVSKEELERLESEKQSLNNQLANAHKVIKKYKQKSRYKLGDLSDEELLDILSQPHHRKKNGTLHLTEAGKTLGVDRTTVKREIKRRQLESLLEPL